MAAAKGLVATQEWLQWVLSHRQTRKYMESAGNFVWKEEYSVGHEELDAQHKSILALLAKLFAMLNAGGTTQSMEALIQEVSEYAEKHFTREEEIMAQCQYPDLAEHREMHSAYCFQVMQIRARAVQDPDGAMFELFCFLKDWWLEHMTDMDAQYAPFLR